VALLFDSAIAKAFEWHLSNRGAPGTDCKEIVDHWGFTNVTYIYAKPWPDGYHFAMFEKLCADNYTDTELIMLLDSDHLLLEPVPIENFFWENKPVIRYREWDEDPSDQIRA
jgi:hypothetical protein